MAIDTENRRRSVQAYTFGLVRPLADGLMTVGDRAVAAWLYFGIQAASRRIRTAVGAPVKQFTRSTGQAENVERSNVQPGYIRRG